MTLSVPSATATPSASMRLSGAAGLPARMHDDGAISAVNSRAGQRGKSSSGMVRQCAAIKRRSSTPMLAHLLHRAAPVVLAAKVVLFARCGQMNVQPGVVAIGQRQFGFESSASGYRQKTRAGRSSRATAHRPAVIPENRRWREWPNRARCHRRLRPRHRPAPRACRLARTAGTMRSM